jgi:23S rRNA pseudouridine1911/1915/1917 synthase
MAKTRNEGFEYRERIEVEGEELLDYLSRSYRHSSRSEWRERIEAGRVLLDSNEVGPRTVLRPGQTLVWRRPPWEEPDAPTGFTVLFEDEALLAVAKPAGLPTLPGAGFLENTLLSRVRAHAPEASPAHRLGRFTSGVVLFAKTPAARAELTRQWEARTVHKRYRALASGDAQRLNFTVAEPIGPVPHALLGTVHAVSQSGKPASSRVEVLEQRTGSFLCDVRIETGRPHQIRIHLAAAGHPLVGDPLYMAGGVPPPGCRALPGDPGYHLHAAELTVRHPDTGDPLTVSCVPPPILLGSGP